MKSESEPLQLYTRRSQSYLRFVHSLRYPAGIRAYFLKSSLLDSNLYVLDAGCGTGIVSLALRQALLARRLTPGNLRAFDLTPKMLEGFRQTLIKQGIEGIDMVQSDVLRMQTLPASWNNFDLIVSSAMLEYVPRDSLVDALTGLRSRLSESGTLLLFISRRNWLMQPLIGRWWNANLYQAVELEGLCRLAGFSTVRFCRFPFPYQYLSVWGHVIEAM